MTVLIDIDETTLAEVDENLRVLHQNRDDFFRRSILDAAARAKREADVARQYAEAYGRNPVRPDEFEIEDEQMEKFWDQI